MREVSLPDTSIAAYRALTPEKLSKDYKDLVAALNVLKEGTYEDLAMFLNWPDKNKASRRMKELEIAQIVYKPGYKKLTSRRRQAYLYRLVPIKTELVQKELFDIETLLKS